MALKKLPVLAVDLGGTKILAALIHNGKILNKYYVPANGSEGPQAVINRIFESIDRVLAQACLSLSRIRGISIAAAGAIDAKNGIITLSPSLPGWRNIPLVKMVREKYPVDIFIIHDANASALGEHSYGAGRGTRDMIFLTVSTGIGGGIIINNKQYDGAAGAAGEIGHMTIDINGPKCNCGSNGCLEAMASGTAMAAAAKSRLLSGEKSRLMEMVNGSIEAVTAKEIGAAAAEGDRLSIEVINRTAIYLGVGLANLVNIFNPEMLVIGGGVSNLGELLLAPARKVVLERAFAFPAQMCKIVRAELGDDSGVVGAAVWVVNQRFLPYV